MCKNRKPLLNIYISVVILSVLFIAACSKTKLSQTWSDPSGTTTYNDIMVVAISDSEQLRRAYETYFADHLSDRGMESIASYKVISHKADMQLNEKDRSSFREIIEAAIINSDVDAVLITHLVSIEEQDVYRSEPAYAIGYGAAYGPTYYTTSYYSNVYGYHGYVTTYVSQPGYFDHESTYTLETNLYDVKTEELVWTTRSRTFAPESMDESIKEITGVIIDDLVSRKIIQ